MGRRRAIARVHARQGKTGTSYRVVWSCPCHRSQHFAPTVRQHAYAVALADRIGDLDGQIHADDPRITSGSLVREDAGAPAPVEAEAALPTDLRYWVTAWIEWRERAAEPPTARTLSGYRSSLTRLEPFWDLDLTQWSDGSDGSVSTWAV